MEKFQMAAEDLRMVLKEEPHNTPAIVSGGHFDGFPVVFLVTRGESYSVKLGKTNLELLLWDIKNIISM